MKNIIFKTIFITMIIFASLLLGSTYYYYSPFYKTITKAITVIHPTKGNNISGIITFQEEKDGLHINGTLKGLTPGKHGIHIHEYGDCGCDNAVCAGDHFNPTHKNHGSPDSPDHHLGDLGNITANDQGVGQYSLIDKQTTLNGPNSIIGRTVIIHADEDDFVTQPTGNSGARVGCGVIGIAKK